MVAWIDGHPDLADVLFLIAAIVFVVAALSRWRSSTEGRPTLPGWFVELGLALVAVGLLVL